MFEKRRLILSQLVKARLEVELKSWKSALKQNFDVALICQSTEFQTLTIDFLRSQVSLGAEIMSLPFTLPTALGQLEKPNQFGNPDAGTTRSVLSRTRSPFIYVSLSQVPRGSGAVTFDLPPLEACLPSPATMITLLLEAAGLERFIDAFDAQKLSALKRILERQGLDDFFDAVIQVAYIVGFRGDDAAAMEHLQSVTNRPVREPIQRTPDNDKYTTSLEKLFEQLIELPDPHDTLKAALAHYVFCRRRVTQAEASRILKVSRSTLQSHLQMAERLKVATYFGPTRAHA